MIKGHSFTKFGLRLFPSVLPFLLENASSMNINHISVLLSLSKADNFKTYIVYLNEYSISSSIIIFSFDIEALFIFEKGLELSSEVSLFTVEIILVSSGKNLILVDSLLN